MTSQYNNSTNSGNPFAQKFDIRKYLDFDASGRAVCPNCGDSSSPGKKNLSVINGGAKDGQYCCFKCGDTQAIRAALGQAPAQIIPTNLARNPKNSGSKPKYLVEIEAIAQDNLKLLNGNSQNSFKALAWLKARGILPEIARHYKLGLARAKFENRYYSSISIPIPDEGKYHRKKRLVPWESENPIQEVRPWSQAGIPKLVYFTHRPKDATETWLCEGEWDAILLGWLVKQNNCQKIAVASFTCGCKAIPSPRELERMPGQVIIFYDRNDSLINGKEVGTAGAIEVARALAGRGKIAKVPMEESCEVHGWDVSEAINSGYKFADFELEARAAEPEKVEPVRPNKFKDKLVSARTIFDRAPDYVEELWTDFFACNEMYLLAAPPRLGKSLFTLALAKAISTGTEFLGRPTKKGKVVLVSKEDAEDKLKERMIAQTWGEEEFSNISFQQEFTLNDLPDLIEYLEQEKPALLVLDTLSKIRTDNLSENDAKLSSLLSPLQDAAMKNGVCVLVVHHTTKGGLSSESREEIFNKVRGTGSLRGVCRGMVVLTEGKDCTRLVAENGRTAGQDLKIRLNPTNLIWQDLGKWNPPTVDLSQKEQVLDWLRKQERGQVVQISDELNLHPKTVHKILTRLIAEKLVGKEGKRRNTVYYTTSIRHYSTKQDFVEFGNVDTDCDTESYSTKSTNFIFKDPGDRLLTSRYVGDNFDPVPPEKPVFVELGDNGDQIIEVKGKNQFDNNSTKVDLSNTNQNEVINVTGGLCSELDNFGNTTKNFSDSVGQPSQGEVFEEITFSRQNCTNKTLTGVRTKAEKYYRVVQEKRGKIEVRNSGERKTFDLALSEIKEYIYRVEPS